MDRYDDQVIALPHFSPLAPFDSTRPWPFEVSGRAQILRRHHLHLEFVLRGDLRGVKIPELQATPSRRDGLWEATCFEAFVGAVHEEPYYEFNFSPSGDWNAYGFKGYREMLGGLPLNKIKLMRQSRGRTELNVTVELPKIEWPWSAGSAELVLGLAAVIELDDGSRAYCALSHTTEKPDFHRHESFILRVGKV